MTWGFETAARTMWGECRGEPKEGQQAVACVLKNRTKDGRWGDSLGSVCLWPWQFSMWNGPQDANFKAVCRLPDNDPTLLHLRDLLQGVLNSDVDSTGGALYYYAVSIPLPTIFKDFIFLKQIGHHKFYTDRKVNVNV